MKARLSKKYLYCSNFAKQSRKQTFSAKKEENKQVESVQEVVYQDRRSKLTPDQVKVD